MCIRKHVQDAIKAVGLTIPSGMVEVARGHYVINVSGVLVRASGSPRDRDVAARKIADDIRAALNRRKS